MSDRERLDRLCDRIDGRSYGAYKALKGTWELGSHTLHVDHVQGDPFAAPSRVRLLTPTRVPRGDLADPDRREAAEDWLLRRFARHLSPTRRGSGRSGDIRVYQPGPEILERSALRLHRDGTAEVRIRIGLPARGRRVLGRQARALLVDDLAAAARGLAVDEGLDAQVHSVVVQRHLRRQLAARGLVAFLADGSILPRASGVDPAPLPGAVPLTAPDGLAITLDSPDGPVRGLGIPEGVTVLVGGGFHGKSTVLQALARGHLDHVPGDGRERVVTRPDAVKIRAEDGRRVADVDISAFLGELPGGRRTDPFRTEDASGSTSQAAAIMEALEVGARVLLLDEDTSATNLLVRDARMRALIPAEREPIIPLVERVRQLHAERGISTVMVVGGVGDYLAAADTVILMDRWRARDATARARELLPDRTVPPGPLPEPSPRIPLPDGLEPGKVKTFDERRLRYGTTELELSGVEQILDRAQAATVGAALRFLHAHVVDGRRSLDRCLDALEAILDDEGVEALSRFDTPDGELVRPRRYEIAAALDRLRTLRVR
jgi:predicted ABC-class ATPase